jgi:hypothetical protein
MRFKPWAGRVLAAAAVVPIISLSVAAPAEANDKRIVIGKNHHVVAVATYNDRTDTYCVKQNSGRQGALLWATKKRNGKVIGSTLTAPDGKRRCSGNLSIREDIRLVMHLRVGNRHKKAGHYS